MTVSQQQSLQSLSAEARYRLLAENASDIVYQTNGLDIEWISPSVTSLLGWTPEELVGKPAAFLISPNQNLDWIATNREELSAGREVNQEMLLLCRDGSERWFRGRARPLVHDGVAIGGFMVGLHEIHDMVLARNTLTEMATTDGQTGLPNRSTILHELDIALQRAMTGRVGVLFLDLDHFKLINESMGHAAGDSLLIDVAIRLRQSVPVGSILGRFGGDEFLVVVPHQATEDRMAALGATLVRDFDAPFLVDGRQITMSASIGAALSRDESTAAALMQEADVALSEAKRGNRGSYQLFDLSMASIAVRRLVVETELREALTANEFRIHYQPVHRLDDGIRTGFEALIRWEHPREGILTPAQFLAVAEDSGLVERIGHGVMRQVCEDIMKYPELDETFAINVSAVQLASPSWLESVLEVIAITGVDPQRLIIELTETAVMSSRRDLSSDLANLRDLGIGIHVDDFGTGYSSISLLRDLPVSGLKLDRSFVSGLDDSSASSYSLAQGLASLTRSIGLDGVAEGVETPVQAAMLRVMGWQHAQGWLFGKAAPLNEWVAP